MLRKKVWQRGGADLVSVAVGMVILAIVTAGTASALVYGRELTSHEEHYKAAAFALRGVMEEVQGELEYVQAARDQVNLNSTRIYAYVNLDDPSDYHGNVRVVRATISRDRVEPVDLQETGPGYDYYLITVRASWTERNGMPNEMAFHTAIFAQRAL
jgi:hypothetical protein